MKSSLLNSQSSASSKSLSAAKNNQSQRALNLGAHNQKYHANINRNHQQAQGDSIKHDVRFAIRLDSRERQKRDVDSASTLESINCKSGAHSLSRELSPLLK
jgi:hypothetical protein